MNAPRAHKILFVDDDTVILRLIQRQLRSYSDRWQLEVADGGVAALARLEAESFDVLVTDMQMPGIDGAALLRKARERWPTTIRIVVSGHHDFDHAVRSVPFAHQRLAKPWEVPMLIATLERACSLRQLVGNDGVRTRLGQIGTLPSSLDSYVRLAAELGNPRATFGSIALVLEHDVAMSAKVLQLANSAFVGSRRDVATVREAVRLVGLDEIRHYVLSPFLDVFDVFTTSSGEVRSEFDRLGHHALLTAHLARRLAGTDDTVPFLAGLLHDVGALFLLAHMRPVADRIRHEALERDCAVEDIEYRRLGTTHADIGGFLLGLWGIPAVLAQAVARHHEHGAAKDADDLTTILRVADWLAKEHVARAERRVESADVLVLPFDEQLLDSAGVTRRLPAYLSLARECALVLEPAARGVVRSG